MNVKVIELDVSLQNQIKSVSESFNAAFDEMAQKIKELDNIEAERKASLTCCGQVQV